ncbi:hypothetical protein KY360_05610 [Candidatus Woesearchaeota archaeon]|nr:hypothetical protein [Candidatus Woesearchaeota archaeon]
MKPREFKNKAGELSYYISEALEALLKEDIPKAEELYHKIKKLDKGFEPEEKGMFDNQIKRLEKEIRLFKKKAKESEIKEAATKASTIVTGIFIIALLYLFLEPAITGLYTAEYSATLSAMPDFYLEIGNEFSLKVYPDNPGMENVRFTDDTELFSISKNGLIRFTPTEEMRGTHYPVIVVKDGSGWFEWAVVKFVIGEEISEGEALVESSEEESKKETEPEYESTNETIEGTNQTMVNMSAKETFNETINKTTEPINQTIELNETETNESIVEISDLEYEKIIVENITAIINQTVYENLNLTNQTD